MKDGAILINTSRGPVVDEADLAAALTSGKLSAAAVDVLCQEPPADGSPLIGLSNCIVTPHIAWAPREARLRLLDVAAANLRGWLAGAQGLPALLRVMPNTPAAIGKGMLALCAEAGTAEEYLAGVEDLLAPAGRVERIAEGQMDAFSAVAGCGPAFVYPFIEALADGGVKVGLPRGQAVTYAAQMVLGAAAMVLESGKHPVQLKDYVCSPGGSTIAGVAALEERGFRSAAIQAVEAAFRRNQELGKV